MSNPNVDLNAAVDELSKPGNEAALESALQSAFNSAGDNPAGAPSQNNVVTDPAPAAAPAPADPAPGSDPSQPGQEPDNKQKPDRFADLLKDRNGARAAAAEAQTNEQILAKQVQDLTSLVKQLQNGEGGKTNEPTDDQPVTAKSVADIISKVLDEREGKSAAAQAAEKSDAEEVSALLSNPEFGETAKPYEAKIRDVMKAHPTVSALAAYAMAVGLEALSGEGNAAPAPGQNRSVIGNRSKTVLRRDTKPTDLKDADMEAYLRSEAAGGRLGV